MDRWDEGDWYEGYMGRWSRPIADKFLAWLDLPPQLDWLDVGCGTGALTGTILRAATPGRLAGIDPSAGYIEAADNALGSNADLRVGDAQALPFDDFWNPLLGGQGPAPSYVMSLSERDRNRLKEALTKTLSPNGGELNLSARAWAIKALH